MKVSSIPTAPNRPPRIRRMSQKELQDPQSSNDLDSSSTSANRWRSRRQSQVGPDQNNLGRINERPSDLNNSRKLNERPSDLSNSWRHNERPLDPYNSWRPSEEPFSRYNPQRSNERLPTIFDQNDDKKCFLSKGWMWLFGGIFCLILIIAIVGIVLGIVLPMQTTSAPDSNATPKMAVVDSGTSTFIECSDTGRGLITLFNESIPSAWTSYSYNYTATQTTPTLLFGFKTDSTHAYYLDDVSVVDSNASSIELLTNPSFENSTVSATDWITSCETTCTSQIISGSQCFGSSGNCFMAYCTANSSSISFLSQSFMAIIGNTYTISYMLKQGGNSSTSSISFYLDVI